MYSLSGQNGEPGLVLSPMPAQKGEQGGIGFPGRSGARGIKGMPGEGGYSGSVGPKGKLFSIILFHFIDFENISKIEKLFLL